MVKKILIIFFGLLLAFALLFYLKVKDFYRTINTAKANHPTVSPEKTSYNILLLGYGGAGHDGAYLTDTMMIAHVDMQTKKANLISLPRDLWVKVPMKTDKDFHAKINSIYQMGLFPEDYPDVPKEYTGDQGAAEYVKKAVGDIVGLKIDNYVAVDFGGFVKIIDSIGGVDINVDKTFDDYEYPIDGKETDLCGKEDQFKQVEKYLTPPTDENAQKEMDDFFKDKPDLKQFLDDIQNDPAVAFPCRYEHLHFDKGPTHMDGTTALKFSRSRHSLQDGTDFGRAARQQKVIEAVKDKVISITFLPRLLPLMDEAKKYIKTDVDVNELQKFIGEAQKRHQYTISSFVPSLGEEFENGTADNGQFILTPTGGIDQWDELRGKVDMVIRGITPTPTPQPTTLSPTTILKKSVSPVPTG